VDVLGALGGVDDGSHHATSRLSWRLSPGVRCQRLMIVRSATAAGVQCSQ
jgi:hypothetical protein